jgi:hypothetical protein
MVRYDYRQRYQSALAVPVTTYKTFFQLDFPQEMVQENQVNMIIYDVKHEVIAEWKN